MNCLCPKCNAPTELNPSDIPAEGLFKKCPECGTNFDINKELFARRALFKSSDIFCAECGNQPGSSLYCQTCHAIFPDFLIIETSSAAKRKFGQLSKAFNAIKALKVGGSAQSSVESYPEVKTKKNKGLPLPGQPKTLLIILFIVTLVSAGGGYYWYQERQATKYAQNYVRALLGVKMARDLNLRISARLAAEMKTGTVAALSAAEQNSLESAKKDVDSLMKRIDKTPQNFISSKDSLNKLYSSYAKLQTTVTGSPGTSDMYTGAVNSIDSDFRKSASALKSGLPEKISAQLSQDSKKFKALQDF